MIFCDLSVDFALGSVQYCRIVTLYFLDVRASFVCLTWTRVWFVCAGILTSTVDMKDETRGRPIQKAKV